MRPSLNSSQITKPNKMANPRNSTIPTEFLNKLFQLKLDNSTCLLFLLLLIKQKKQKHLNHFNSF